MTSVLQQLRSATASQHEALEKTPPFCNLMTEHFSTSGYMTQLQAIRAFHYAVAKSANASLSHPAVSLLNIEGVCHALDTDLKTLGAGPAPAFNSSYPISVPEIDLIAGAYVWLGSSMGAKMIYRWLVNNVSETMPLQYYQTLSGCSQNWAKYREYLDQLSVSPADSDAICKSAVALFTGIRQTATAASPASAGAV